MINENRLSVEEMDKLLATDDSIVFGPGLTYSKLVKNDNDLKKFLTRFVVWDYSGKVVSPDYDAISEYIEIQMQPITKEEAEKDGFRESLTIDGVDIPLEYEAEPRRKKKEVSVTGHNRYFEKPFELNKAKMRYVPIKHLKVVDPPKYPCIVVACFDKDFDRCGDIITRMVHFVPAEVMTGSTVVL